MNRLIRFRCECGKKLKATPDIVGKKVRCTNCVRTHRVPEADHLPPKKTDPATKSLTSTKPKVSPPTAKSTAGHYAPQEIESKQQDVVVSPPKKTTSSKPKTTSASTLKPLAPKPNVASEKPSLIIADEMAANEPSLLPTNDDSDSRFKLDPKFDPEPSETPLDPASNFEFDFDATNIDTTQTTPSSPNPQRPNFQRSTNKSKRILSIVAATAGVLLLSGIVYFTCGNSAYPKEFSERPEVRNYVSKIEEFRKSQRTLKIVSEAYVKSKSPTAQEREQIEAFNRSIEPLANKQVKLDEALELFQASEHERARSALITATQTLDQKIPELQSKAKDFSSNLR